MDSIPYPTAQREICHQQPARVEPREKKHLPPWRSTAFGESFKVHMDWDLRVLLNKEVKLVT
jgi:hypothetical protein